MTTLQEAAQKALEALREATTYTSSPSWSPSMTRECEEVIESLRSALAQQGEPVAYLVYAKGSRRYSTVTFDVNKVPEIYIGGEAIPLYTAAPACQVDRLQMLVEQGKEAQELAKIMKDFADKNPKSLMLKELDN